MGRQVGIIATQEDLEELLSFLRGATEIAIFRGFAQSIEELRAAEPDHFLDRFSDLIGVVSQ